MYPFRNAALWWLKGRHAHLLEIVRPVVGDAEGAPLGRAAGRLRLWGRVRAVVGLLLSLGVVATGFALLIPVLPFLAGLQPGFAMLAAVGGAWTGVLGLVFLFTARTLGQIEIDILGLLLVSGGKIQS